MQEKSDTNGRPKQIAALADDRQGYTGRLSKLQDSGNFASAKLINTHAHGHKLENNIDNAIHRFQYEGGEECGRQGQTDEGKRNVDFRHAGQVKTCFE